MNDLSGEVGGAPGHASAGAGHRFGAINLPSREVLYFLLSCVLVFIFYYPAIVLKSQNAGHLYTGDIVGFYSPTIMKIHKLLHEFHFTALDYSLYNGSSDFFLSPNLFTFHPIVIIYSFVAPMSADTPGNLGRLLTFMMMLHSIAALYFSLRLCRRVLGLEFGPSLFAAILFTCNLHMVDSLGQPPFFFVATMLPWACCAILESVERPGLRRSFLASVPIVLMLVGGYIPLGLAAVAFSSLTIVGYLAYTHLDRNLSTAQAMDRALRAAMPVVLGVGACAFYVLALYLFSKETNSNEAPNLFYSAQQLSENPTALLRIASTHWTVPGPSVEFSLFTGLIPMAIATVFIFSAGAFSTMRRHELATLLACGAAYFVSVLAIFGSYSVTSSLIYYFVPQIGKMHIYQRFLLFSDLAFAVAAALMLVAVTRLRPTLTIRVVFAVLSVLTFASAFIFAFDSSIFSKEGIQPAVVVELLCATVMTGVLLAPSRTFIYLAAAALAILPGLDRMYERSANPNLHDEQVARMPVQFKPGESDAIAGYLRQHSTKTYIKYADITPMWRPEGVESFPKVFPYMVQNKINLSSYSGFTFYLSSRLEYRNRMPVLGDVKMTPDWEYLHQSGADFVVLDAAEAAKTAVGGMMDVSGPADVYRLPGNFIIAPLKPSLKAEPLFDNGMIRVSAYDPRAGALNNWAKGSLARESSSAAAADKAVDGNEDGDFTHGSVAHTGQDRNAWLELDLGQSRSIGSVRIWNRTDCCMERIANAWVFVSDTPFGDADTATVLKSRPNTWARQILSSKRVDVDFGSVSGRYVRLQLPGDEPPDSGFLHIAELEVFPPGVAGTPRATANAGADPVRSFSANFANRMTVDLDLKVPATFEYLFSDNPRLVYTVDRRRVKFDVSNGVPRFTLPAGRHTVEIKYHDHPLAAFWIVYGAYWAAVLAIVVLGLRTLIGELDRYWEACVQRKSIAPWNLTG